MNILLLILILLTLISTLAIVFKLYSSHAIEQQLQQFVLQLHEKMNQDTQTHLLQLAQHNEQLQKLFYDHRAQFDARQLETFKLLQESMQKSMQDMRQQITQTLESHSKNLNDRMEGLTNKTSDRLKEISGQVEKRLTEGFEKTTATFADILKRLALIDEAQKKITELSSNVISLQSVLNDKRTRGAFGEVQLNNLIRNVMPESTFSLQHTLSNAKRCDCILFLPEPTGNLVIDAKFPLETFRKLSELSPTSTERRAAEQQFRQDIKTHIHAIAEKYIIPSETADGAMMFIPAEAIFAEIHAHYPELVELANQKRVWLVSPTTMMAVLTTARAVLKDADTRKQVHIIQEHLTLLSRDFGRFQQRMDALAKHIDQAHEDVNKVHMSAKKISSRFSKIERLDLETDTDLDPPTVKNNEITASTSLHKPSSKAHQ